MSHFSTTAQHAKPIECVTCAYNQADLSPMRTLCIKMSEHIEVQFEPSQLPTLPARGCECTVPLTLALRPLFGILQQHPIHLHQSARQSPGSPKWLHGRKRQIHGQRANTQVSTIPWPRNKDESVSDKWEWGKTKYNDSAALASPFFSGSVQLCGHGR